MTGHVYGPVFICLTKNLIVNNELIVGEYAIYPPGLFVTFFSQKVIMINTLEGEVKSFFFKTFNNF